MDIGFIAALGAAVCWSAGSLVSHAAAQRLGALAFTRIRMTLVFVMLAAVVTIEGSWGTLTSDRWSALLISGFIGIFVGDTALFATMRRLGPRRTGILFSLNAPITVLLGWLFLNETLSLKEGIGCAAVFVGVVLAILFGKRKSQLHNWENINGPLWIAVLLGLIAASGQAVGIIAAKPALDAGADPIAASAMRVGAAAFSLTVLSCTPIRMFKPLQPLDLKYTLISALSGFLGMGLGMTLFLFALSHGESGIVATLAATSPVMILPIIWIITKERPAIMAWIGAVLVILGSSYILNS